MNRGTYIIKERLRLADGQVLIVSRAWWLNFLKYFGVELELLR